MIVVDTSILVDHLRGNKNATRFLVQEAARGPVLVPALVIWELWKGAETPSDRNGLSRLLASLEPDLFTPAMARLAGELHQEHRIQGKERPAWDLIIAAHAIHHECPLASIDCDYEGIDGLLSLRPYSE